MKSVCACVCMRMRVSMQVEEGNRHASVWKFLNFKELAP